MDEKNDTPRAADAAPPPLPAGGTGSPDGTAAQADKIRSELGTGWRGYRRVLAWLSASVSPEEAERAEAVFRFRRSAFLAVLSAAALLVAAVVGAETLGRFASVSVLRRVLLLLVFSSSVLLRARGQVAYAGRVLFLVALPAFFVDPPSEVAAEASIFLDVWFPAGVLCAFLAVGFAVDFGAAVFRSGKRHVASRVAALVFAAAFAAGAESLFGTAADPTAAGWTAAVLPFAFLAVCALPPVRKRLGRSGEIADVENVVEVAFSREAKTIGGRGLALAGVSGVALLLLLGLNARESMDWRSRKDAILVDTEFSERPWFWKETRSYLEKADFDRTHAFFLPDAELLGPGPEAGGASGDSEEEESYRSLLLWKARTARVWSRFREWAAARSGLPPEELEAEWGEKAGPAFKEETDRLVLTPRGERIGTLLDEIDADPDDGSPYEALLAELAPFRKTSADADWIAEHLGADAVVVHASAENIRPSAEHPRGRTIHRAELRLGAVTQDPDAIDLAADRTQASLFPCLVCAILAFLFLWSRGGDSGVGLWTGVYLVSLAFSALVVDFAYVVEGNEATELADVGENLTRHALLAFHAMSESSAPGAVARFLFLVVYGGAWTLVFLASAAQPILFLRLCWPTPEDGSRFSVWTKRVLKFVAVFFAAAVIGAVFTVFRLNMFVGRLVIVSALVLAGVLLRRRTRARTEVPVLGWEFAAAWFLVEAAAYLAIVAFSRNAGFLRFASVPFSAGGWTLTPAAVVCGSAAALAALLCFRMCLRRGFLRMLTPGRLAFAVFAVAIPCLAELSEQLVERVFEGSVLSSELGDEMLGVLVVVLLFAPCWDLLCNRLRRLSVRQLPKVERSAERALESLLDEDPALAFQDSIRAALAAVPLRRYAFYARTSPRSFVLVASEDAPAELPLSFEASRHLQKRLAKLHAAFDLAALAWTRSLFFQSFELHRIGTALAGGSGREPDGIVLPIRLGRSLRGILYAPAEGETGMPGLSNDEVTDAVNDLGLAEIASSRSGKTAR